MSIAAAEAGAPAVRLDIECPDRPLSRRSTLVRPFLALPVAVLLGLLTASTSLGGGLIVAPVALMILFRAKYPAWWFAYNRELTAFGLRVGAYLALLDDRYPSTDEPQAVRLTLERPDVATQLSRPLVLVKWLLALPHYLVLAVLWLAAIPVVVCAWVAILVTGRYPRWAFDFVVGVARWQLRVSAYAILLVTDRYPPFSLR
jgi:hypothetical protein